MSVHADTFTNALTINVLDARDDQVSVVITVLHHCVAVHAIVT